jgi:hypothetical protein
MEYLKSELGIVSAPTVDMQADAPAQHLIDTAKQDSSGPHQATGDIGNEDDTALRVVAETVEADRTGVFRNEDGIAMLRVGVNTEEETTMTTNGFQAIRTMSEMRRRGTAIPTTEVLNPIKVVPTDTHLVSTRPSVHQGQIPDRTTRDKLPLPTTSTRPCEFCGETFDNTPVLAMSTFNTVLHEWCSQMCAWNWCKAFTDGKEVRPMILNFLRKIKVAPIRMQTFVPQFAMRHFHTTEDELARGSWSGINPEEWRSHTIDIQVRAVDEKCCASAVLILARESQRAMNEVAKAAVLDDASVPEDERRTVADEMKPPKTVMLLGPMCQDWLQRSKMAPPTVAEVENAVRSAIEDRTLRTSVFQGGKVDHLTVPKNTVPMQRVPTGVTPVLDEYARQREQHGSHAAVDLATSVPATQKKSNARRSLKVSTAK